MPLVQTPPIRTMAAGGENQRLAQVDAAQEEPGDQDGRVGERGAQVRLDEHQQHRNAHQCKGLEDVPPGQIAAAQVGKVAGHDQNQHQLDPLRGLKLHGADADPAARAEHLVSHGFDRDQRNKEDAVSPGSPIEEPVVIDLGQR